MNCVNCNTETHNPKFCSKSCSAQHNNKMFPKRVKKKLSCEDCGIELLGRRKKCDPCRDASFDITLGEAMYKQQHKASAFALVRSRARSSVQGRPVKCENCGYSKHVEVCHMKPISTYPEDTKIAEINHPDNLRLLCPNCHWEHDHEL